MEKILQDLQSKMDASLDAFKRDLAALRTGRASASLVDSILVDAYGSMMPLAQVCTVSVPEARLITLQVWDRGMIKSVEKALLDSGIGINPIVDGQLIRLPIPTLSEERRRELAKLAAKHAETAKVSVRNVRRDGMENLRDLEKKSEMSEDEHRRLSEKVQELTNQYIEKVEELFQHKEKDIMQI